MLDIVEVGVTKLYTVLQSISIADKKYDFIIRLFPEDSCSNSFLRSVYKINQWKITHRECKSVFPYQDIALNATKQFALTQVQLLKRV
jgi:hypothetical protein